MTETEEITEKKPFDFLKRADPAYLLNILQKEHPQTAAVVLSHLEPARAAVMLQNLPRGMQSDIARRISTMDNIVPEVLQNVETALEEQLNSFSGACFSYAGGVECMVEILNFLDRTTENQIIEALEDEDPELAEAIKERLFTFNDIILLDDRAIQKVLREVDSLELAKALKGTNKQVEEKIFNNMSKRAAAMLKEDMDYMGPIRLSDAEESRKKIVEIIRHLEEAGEIIVVNAGDDQLVGGNKEAESDDLEI